jgi:hypothetical protein
MNIIVILLVIFGVGMRLLPHPANFAPILAIGLFAGTYLDRKYALWLPIIIMLISDFFIGFYNPMVMLAVYGSFFLSVFLGFWIRKNKTFTNVLVGTLGGALLFFFVTNFAVWVGTSLYSKTLDGLITCYVMAVPFFRNSLAGDLVYVSILFGAYELVQYYIKIRSKVFSLGRIND